jgi:hypothetical protein
MKIKNAVLSLFATLSLAFTAATATAHEDHAHEKKKAGPHGGRILTKVDPHAEFFVTAERKVQITFLGDDGKAVPPSGQIVTVTAGSRAAPATLSFVRVGDSFLSETKLPDGNNFPAVIQIKASADAKTVTEKFNVNLATCSECSLAEYACICSH